MSENHWRLAINGASAVPYAITPSDDVDWIQHVGIETASPGGKLEVQRTNDSGAMARLGTADGYHFDFSRNAATGGLQIQGNQTGANNIVLAPASGDVGIGTTAPGMTILNSSGNIGIADVEPGLQSRRQWNTGASSYVSSVSVYADWLYSKNGNAMPLPYAGRPPATIN